MASYQDIEARLSVVERKVDFVLKAFSVIDPTNPFSKPRTFLEEYYLQEHFGLRSPTQPLPEDEVVEAEVIADAPIPDPIEQVEKVN